MKLEYNCEKEKFEQEQKQHKGLQIRSFHSLFQKMEKEISKSLHHEENLEKPEKLST